MRDQRNQLLSNARDWRLRTKLVLGFLVVVVPTVVLLTLAARATLTAQLVAQARLGVANTATSRAAALDAQLAATERSVMTVADQPDIVRFAAASTENRAKLRDLALIDLLSLRNAEASHQDVAIVDPSGTIILSNVADFGQNVAAQSYFTQSLAGSATISDMVVTSGGPSIFYTAPIRSGNGEVLGVLRLRADLTTLQNAFFAAIPSNSTSAYLALVDSNGVVLMNAKDQASWQFRPIGTLNDAVKSQIVKSEQFGPNTPLLMNAPVGDTDLANALANTSKAFEFTHTNVASNNVAEYGSARVLDSKPWRLLSFQPEAPVLAGVNAVVQQSLLTGLVVLVLAIIIAFLVARVLLVPINALLDVVRRIGAGDLEARVVQPARDEIGQVGRQLNATLDDVLALVQTRAERDYLNDAVTRLLNEVSTVAEGDLTVQAQVTPDMLGSVADAFNFMIEELRKIVQNVQKTTFEVSNATSEVVASSELLAVAAESQADRVVQTSQTLEDVAVAIRNVAQLATESAQVAQQARSNAESGGEAVFQTIAGMGRIRDNVQETSKTIKRLGESSQEIGQIVELIEDIADQTNLLALNAAIQAAMAGEHGRGFAVVAEEVRRLAERSTDATKQIANLVKSIQTETNEAVGAMEEGIREVVEGSRLADTAGRRLQVIQDVVVRLDDLIQTISLSSEQHAVRTTEISRVVADLSHVTRDTSSGTRQNAQTLTGLQSLADQLRSSVAAFKMEAA